MNNSESRGGVSEFSSAVGAVASPVPAVGVLPVDEVQALLDDLAHACDTYYCSSAAVWIAWCVCSCSDDLGDTLLLCSVDYADVLDGLVGWPDDCEHADHRIVVIHSERIRSKPTK